MVPIFGDHLLKKGPKIDFVERPRRPRGNNILGGRRAPKSRVGQQAKTSYFAFKHTYKVATELALIEI